MKLTDLFENRFGEELDGWYVLDKATDAVVAGPFTSSDEAQKKAMRPPLFANHHRYKVKAFGSALKEDLGTGVSYLAFVDPDGVADWDAIAVFNNKADADNRKKAWKTEAKGADARVEQHKTFDGKFVVVMVDYSVPSFKDSGVVFVCADVSKDVATKKARQIISSDQIMGVENLDDLSIMRINPATN